jgi:hypothetical protein
VLSCHQGPVCNDCASVLGDCPHCSTSWNERPPEPVNPSGTGSIGFDSLGWSCQTPAWSSWLSSLLGSQKINSHPYQVPPGIPSLSILGWPIQASPAYWESSLCLLILRPAPPFMPCHIYP